LKQITACWKPYIMDNKMLCKVLECPYANLKLQKCLANIYNFYLHILHLHTLPVQWNKLYKKILLFTFTIVQCCFSCGILLTTQEQTLFCAKINIKQLVLVS
jgi:hypothetical protein